MSLRETDNSLLQALQALQSRVETLESGDEKGGGDDGLKARLSAERQGRIAQQELKNFARKQEKPDRPTSYANPKRQEEAVKRHTTRLDAPAPKPEQKKVEKGGTSNAVEFYCWHQNKLSVVTFNCLSTPTPYVPPA